MFTTPELTALLFTFKALKDEQPELELFSLSVEFPSDEDAAEAADAAAAAAIVLAFAAAARIIMAAAIDDVQGEACPIFIDALEVNEFWSWLTL